MRFRGSTGLYAAALVSAFASRVMGFGNTSPFVMFSPTADVLKDHGDQDDDNFISSMTSVDRRIRSYLKDCPTSGYVLVSQQGLHSSDLSDDAVTPHLLRGIDSAKLKYVVPNVEGEIDIEALQDYVVEKCNAQVISVNTDEGSFQPYIDSHPRVIRMDFPPLPSGNEKRKLALQKNDAMLYSVTSLLPAAEYIVIYASTPIGLAEAASESSSSFAQSNSYSGAATNVTDSTGGLFDHYQYFTPGIFMGIFSGIFLLSLLGLALKGLASLKISYHSFDKDIAAKTKQQ